jgi:hypothetical protein
VPNVEFRVSSKKQQPRRFPVVPASSLIVNKPRVLHDEIKEGFDWLEGVRDNKPEKQLPAVRLSSQLTPRDQKRLEKYKQNKKDNRSWNTAETLFGERGEEIMEMIERDDRDGYISAIYKQLMKMMVDLVPIVEKGVRATKGFRGVRSLNEMISQMREMIADMQAVQDKGLLGQTLVSRHVRPAFLDIAMQMIANNERMLAEILHHVPTDKREDIRTQMKGAERELGKFIQAQYNNIAENLIKGLT